MDFNKVHFPCGHWHKKVPILRSVPVANEIVVCQNVWNGRLINLSMSPFERVATFDSDMTEMSSVCFAMSYDYVNNIAYMGINDGTPSPDVAKIIKVDVATMTQLDELVLLEANGYTLQCMCDYPENGKIYAVIRQNSSPHTTTLYEIDLASFAVTRTLVFTGGYPGPQAQDLFPDSTRGYIYYRPTGNGATESYIKRVSLTTFTEDATAVEVGKGVSDGYFWAILTGMTYDKASGMLYCAYSSTEFPIGTITKTSIASVDVDSMSVVARQELTDNPQGGYNFPIKLAVSDDYIFSLMYGRRTDAWYIYLDTINRSTLAHESFTRIGPSDGAYPYFPGDLAVSGNSLYLCCAASSVAGEVAFYQKYTIGPSPVLDAEVQFLDTEFVEAGTVAQMIIGQNK